MTRIQNHTTFSNPEHQREYDRRYAAGGWAAADAWLRSIGPWYTEWVWRNMSDAEFEAATAHMTADEKAACVAAWRQK